MTAATQFVTLRGIRFAYSDEGVGPIVIYAHGLTESRAAEAAAPMYDLAPIVEAGFRLIRYDARGHGESAGTLESTDYEWTNLADDFLAIADHFSPGVPVSAMGSSMGTATILYAVVRRPERFHRMVLTAPPTAWETRAGQAAIYDELAAFVESNPPEALDVMLAEQPAAPIFVDIPGFPQPPSIAHALMPTVFRGAGASDLPDPELLRAIETPTLLLPWATDPGHPVSTSEKLHALIAGSVLEVAGTAAEIATWGARAAVFLP